MGATVTGSPRIQAEQRAPRACLGQEKGLRLRLQLRPSPAHLALWGGGGHGQRPTTHFLPPGPESLPLPTVSSHESQLARALLLEKPFPQRMEVGVEWTGPGGPGVKASPAGTPPGGCWGPGPHPSPPSLCRHCLTHLLSLCLPTPATAPLI